MNLYVVRHGHAENVSLAKRDFDRLLTSKGKEQIRRAAIGWKTLISQINLILTSPYQRAFESAKITAEVLGYEGDLIVDNNFAPGCKTNQLIEIINALDAENILIVGHEPDLSNHISNFISQTQVYLDIRRASIAKISFPNKALFSKGTLEYLIPPETFQ
jgi:phosphohistidine phosphatase